MSLEIDNYNDDDGFRTPINKAYNQVTHLKNILKEIISFSGERNVIDITLQKLADQSSHVRNAETPLNTISSMLKDSMMNTNSKCHSVKFLSCLIEMICSENMSKLVIRDTILSMFYEYQMFRIIESSEIGSKPIISYPNFIELVLQLIAKLDIHTLSYGKINSLQTNEFNRFMNHLSKKYFNMDDSYQLPPYLITTNIDNPRAKYYKTNLFQQLS